MQNKPKTSPKDFFLHLLMIITLYGSAISIIAILFQLINIYLPDAFNARDFGYYNPYSQSLSIIRSALAALIVMFPMYMGTMLYLKKEYIKEPAKRLLPIRKWLIYLTIFIGTIVSMVDIITLIHNLLEGELTLKFLLKVLSVLIVIVSILYYYIKDINSHKTKK